MATTTRRILVEITVEYDENKATPDTAQDEAFYLTVRPKFDMISNGVQLKHVTCSESGIEFANFDENGNEY